MSIRSGPCCCPPGHCINSTHSSTYSKGSGAGGSSSSFGGAAVAGISTCINKGISKSTDQTIRGKGRRVRSKMHTSCFSELCSVGMRASGRHHGTAHTADTSTCVCTNLDKLSLSAGLQIAKHDNAKQLLRHRLISAWSAPHVSPRPCKHLFKDSTIRHICETKHHKKRSSTQLQTCNLHSAGMATNFFCATSTRAGLARFVKFGSC